MKAVLRPALLCGLALLALFASSCDRQNEDPLAAMAARYGGERQMSLADYYAGAEGIKLKIKGIVFDIDEARVPAVLDAIGSSYLAALPFRIEKNYKQGGRKDRIAVVSSINQFALIKALGCGGRQDKVSNAQVIKALKAIHAKQPIRIIGAGRDFVEFRLLEKPSSWIDIAQICAGVAPNIINHGAGDLQSLTREIAALGGATLWWY